MDINDLKINVPWEIDESDPMDKMLYEMANIHPDDTGLKTSLHAMYNGNAEGLPHGPRVKVTTNQHGRIPIQLRPEVKLAVKKNLRKEDKEIVKEAILYISDNLQLFIDHWYGRITDRELLNILHDSRNDNIIE